MPLTSLLLNPLHENVSEQVHVSHYINYSSPNQDLTPCVRWEEAAIHIAKYC